MTISEAQQHARRVRDAIATVVVGKDDVLDTMLIGLLANGHILIEDVPGVAKTLIARSLAQALDIAFSRIQFTPDLLPGDVTGTSLYDQRERRFEFRPGPIFANLVLADEVNRATPKTQSALLEAMQERQVTVEGVGHQLSEPFIVIATQNPIELEGTYPLPEAQLDRFVLRTDVGYPSAENELEMLERRVARRTDEVNLAPVIDGATLLAMQRSVEDVYVESSLARYVVDIVRETRTDTRVQVGASPRGTMALLSLARASAVLAGRDFVTPEDVKEVAVRSLAHRVILKPEHWVRGTREVQVVESALSQVETPETVIGPRDRSAGGPGVPA